MIFASKNAFKLNTLSRRDDLISLVYFLLYLVDGDLVFLASEDGEESKQTQQQEFAHIKKVKNAITSAQLTQDSEEGERMISFIDEIFKLRFDEKPNYDKLKFNLVKILLDLNQTPNKVYDWNEKYMKNKNRDSQSNEESKQAEKPHDKMFGDDIAEIDTNSGNKLS